MILDSLKELYTAVGVEYITNDSCNITNHRKRGGIIHVIRQNKNKMPLHMKTLPISPTVITVLQSVVHLSHYRETILWSNDRCTGKNSRERHTSIPVIVCGK